MISVFPLIYCGFYFSIKYTITKVSNEDQQVIPDIVRLSSSGPAGELYPDSLGDYGLMTDVSHNDFPVYQHLAREDRYIIYNGELIISYYSIMNNHITLANSWFITHEISNSGPREFISDITAEEKGHIADGLDWQYNTYPNCQTVRSEYCCQKILVSLMFHWLQWTIKTLERISRRCFHSG